VRYGGGSYQRSPDHIGIECASPGLAGDVDEVAQRADSGGIDQGIDPAEAIGRLGNGDSTRRIVGHVARDGVRLRAGLTSRVHESVEATGQEGDGGTAPTESHRNRSSEAA
jgi:hypothetical protein